ncbi:PAS domain S-box [Halovivax ruber XH-70]|uniref:histidine kinase n=1 Tax=Halovivax ruber (strain DSM 18193 / JCM 13892 / XH-70) TaxID=797302 RepID=L0IFK8_HALRX|nr:PAS domain-containing sensor histidine kinase [Halovivax ruber]AGB17006.1 PAS domain S-box [Halovivax ruber XH-70]
MTPERRRTDPRGRAESTVADESEPIGARAGIARESVRTDGGDAQSDGFASHPDPLVHVDADGRVIAMNERAQILFGDELSVGSPATASLAGAAAGDVIEREVAGATRQFEVYIVAGPAHRVDEQRVLHVRPVDGSTSHEMEATEAPESVPSTSTFEQYETIMQVLPDPVYATDETGTLTFVNRAFTEQFGIDRTAVTESEIHFAEITTDDGAASIVETLRTLLDDGDPTARKTIESVVVTADGRHLTVENSLALRPTHDGFAGAVGVLRDVTERQRREEIVSVMDRALRHNLRTNVNIISGYAETLEPVVDDEHREALRTIKRSATWLSKLGETIRTLERSIETAPDGTHRVDVERLVTDCVDWARERHSSASIDVTISSYGELDVGDPIEIALRNVIENAIVHNDAAAPTVNVWVGDAPQEGWVELTVADDGPGIPETEQAVVLGTAMPTQLAHGSGLGLWLTSWIVQVFDGEMDIQANDPTGSVVTLTLRRARNASD